MNDNRDNELESLREQLLRLEIQKIRLKTERMGADMRRDRVRLVLDIIKWIVVAVAVVTAFFVAVRLGSL
ncbi:MAG: hypothetical protein OXK76_07615 [Gammaproteobacteria bacterium]|nr:hypothetical protein [Gammaproteobacteria bacterium]